MKDLTLKEKRKSVREYKKKKLSEEDRNFINELIQEKPLIAYDASLEFVFVEEGIEASEKLSGYAGYFGKMIEAPHYFAMLSKEEEKCVKITGYVGEWLILNALKNGIGTCWIEVKDSEQVKEILDLDTAKEIVALIAIGYPKKEYNLKNIYGRTKKGSLSTLTDLGYPNINNSFSKDVEGARKAINEIVFLNEWGNVPDIKELEERGLHEALFYMRFAPSYGNLQPWYFIVRSGEIDLVIEENKEISNDMQLLNAGIAMFYFEEGLHNSGIKGKWDLTGLESGSAIPEGYTLAGRYYL
ncbi:MAG: nitroreductase family protein [Clostridiales bacterium]|nr:nitroreductase family protein [Clostridiales bacterium]